MDIHNLGDTWPAGMSFLSFAGVTAYDEKTLTIKPPDGAPYGIPAEPAFASSGFVGVCSMELEGRHLRKDWMWLKVGDPVLNDDGTQCYPILDRHGHAEVKAGDIALYTTATNIGMYTAGE